MAAVMGRVEHWVATGCLCVLMLALAYFLWWSPRQLMHAMELRLARVEALVDPATLGPSRAELARKIADVRQAVERQCGCQ